jgi:hypothetical protein
MACCDGDRHGGGGERGAEQYACNAGQQGAGVQAGFGRRGALRGQKERNGEERREGAAARLRPHHQPRGQLREEAGARASGARKARSVQRPRRSSGSFVRS